MAITILESNKLQLGISGSIVGGQLVVKNCQNQFGFYPLSDLIQLDLVGERTAQGVSLTALAQKAGTLAVSSAFVAGGSVTGGIMSALMGNDLAEKTAERQKVIAYQYQIAFKDNTKALIEVNESDHKLLANYAEQTRINALNRKVGII